MINVLVLINSCGTMSGANQSTGRSTNNKRLLNPEDVVGKNLVGSDESGSYRFTLNQNGSLEYAINEDVYNGTWSFNKKEIMYRYTFDWTEKEKSKGYIMDFMADGDEITLAGHGYKTDSYTTFMKKLAFEE